MPGQLLYKRVTQATFLQRLLPGTVNYPWRYPPHGQSAPLTEYRPRQPAVCSPSAQVSDPSHVPMPTVHALPTLQGYAIPSPPAREGGCAGSTANQTADRKRSLVGRSPRYSSKSRTIQHEDPAGTVNAQSPATSTLLPAAAATLRSTAPAPVCLEAMLLELQMLYNDSATTWARTIAGLQVRLRAC